MRKQDKVLSIEYWIPGEGAAQYSLIGFPFGDSEETCAVKAEKLFQQEVAHERQERPESVNADLSVWDSSRAHGVIVYTDGKKAVYDLLTVPFIDAFLDTKGKN